MNKNDGLTSNVDRQEDRLKDSRRANESALFQNSMLMETALGNTDAIIFLKDRGGRYSVMSPWYEKKFYGKRRFSGKTDYDFFPKEYADEFRKHDEITMESGTLIEFQEIIPHGERLETCITYKFPIFDHQGKVCGVCGFSTPMTTDCQALQTFKISAGFYSLLFNAIRENEVRYRTLFEAANDAIFLVKDNVLVDCNRKAAELFRCEKESILGKTFLKFSPKMQDDGRPSEQFAIEKVKAAYQGIEQHFEWRHRRYDHTEFESEVSLNKIDLGGEAYIQAIVRDISERKHAEEAKEQSLKIISEL